MPYIELQIQEYVEKYDPATPLRFKIVKEGIKVTPDVDIQISDLQRGKDGIKYKKFLNTGNGGITFKVKVLVYRKELWTQHIHDNNKNKDIWNGGLHVTAMLKNIYEKMKPVNIVTDLIDIKNGTYIMTNVPSREQEYPDFSIWELEFTTYHPLMETVAKNDNRNVKKAIKSAKAKQVKQKNKSGKDKTTTRQKLKKCDYKKLVYSKKKKTVECVKHLQTILKRQKLYDGAKDGWYGKDTTKAVKKFQEKYQKKYKLKKPNGKVDKKTFDVLCKV